MHDQVGVRVGDGRLHVEKQADARVDAEPLLVAEAIDVPAVDVLEHEVRLAGARDAGVDEPGDVRMREPREDRAFALEALFAAARRRSAAFSSLSAAWPSKRPSLREASHTVPMPPWPIRRHERVGADGDARRAALPAAGSAARIRETPRR